MNICMARICDSVEIRRSIDEVFDFITTPTHWPLWHPASLRVSAEADHSLQPGEEVVEQIKVAGHRGEARWRVRERSAPHRWIIEGTGNNGGRATITYTLTERPGGTEFERELLYSMPNPVLAALDWLFIRSRMKADSAEALRRLKDHLNPTVEAANR